MKPSRVELAALAGASYGSRRRCRGWFREAEHAARGLRARAWRNDGTLVVTLRGTASLGEAWQDLRLLRKREPAAWKGACPFVGDLARDADRVVLVGHSIGGAFAHFLSLEFDLPAVTFNAPGIECITGSEPGARITNLCAHEDWIWRLSGPCLGRTIEVRVADGHRPRTFEGPRGVAAALRQGARRIGYTRFILRSLKLHAVDVLRDALAHGSESEAHGTPALALG